MDRTDLCLWDGGDGQMGVGMDQCSVRSPLVLAPKRPRIHSINRQGPPSGRWVAWVWGFRCPPEPPQLVLAGPVRPQVAVGAGLGNESLVCSHSDGMGIGSYLGPASLYGQVKSPVGCTSSSTTYLGFR